MPDRSPAPPRVLVTGATGFLGTAVTRELLDRGHEVVALIRDHGPAGDFLLERLWKRVRVVRGRVEDRGRLRQTLAIHDIQAVVHLAAPARRAAGDYAADWLFGLAEAVAESAPGVPLVAAAHRAARRHADELALVAPAPVRFELLPTLFGPDDRRTERLAPRTALALVAGEWSLPPTAAEASELFASVAAAARHLADAAVLPALAPAADGEVGDAFAGPLWSGADLFRALTRPQRTDSALVAACDELLAWTRLRHARPVTPLRAAA